MSGGATHTSCGQRCPDCGLVVHVAGTWSDWDRIHLPLCTGGQILLPIEDVELENMNPEGAT